MKWKHLFLVFAAGLILLVGSSVSAQVFKVKSMVTPSGRVEYVKGEVLVKYKAGLDEKNMARLATRLGTQEISVHGKEIHKLRVPAGMTELEFVSLLEDSPEVEFAELNTICHASFVPNDPFYSPYQWHFPNIDSEQAWDISTGAGVLVAILDTGIAYEDYAVPAHESSTVRSGVTQYQQAPDLAGTSFAAGYDYVNNDTHPNDNNGHGTHVAGTVAQTTNNSLGTAGLAFDCTLMPVKVLDYTGSGSASELIDGLHYAADNGADVASMSLSWPPGYDPGAGVHGAIQYAYNAGVVLVAASGNSGVSTVSYPAAYSEVIAVGATRYDNQLTDYSQYGTAQELVAPGGDVSVDQNSDGYGDGVLQQTFDAYDPGPPEVKADPTSFSYWFYQGTSMATPHVAAVVAMLIANGQTGVENIRSILHATALDLGPTGWDQQYGYGKVDAYAALTYNATLSSISGSVIDDETGLGFQGAVVSYTGPESGSDTTDANGAYAIDSLSPGTYTLTASGFGCWQSDPEVITVPPDTSGVDFHFLAPLVTVLTPNGAQAYQVSSPVSIDWDACDPDGIDSVSIYLSTDGGGTFPTVIAHGIPNSPPYAWTAPEHPYSQCRIKVRVYDPFGHTAEDMSGSDFSVFDDVNPSVTVLSPNGYEWLEIGQQFEITWQATDNGVVDSVSIYLSTDGGSSYPYTVSTGEANDGSYMWTVPAHGSDFCRIKIVAYDGALNTAQDASDFDFTISDMTSPVVTVVAPNGGESWAVGSQHEIRWVATDNDTVTKIDIRYSTDGGSTYPNVIATNEPNDSTYLWTVPATVSDSCLVRITAYDASLNSASDSSDSLFTIYEPDLTAPVVTVVYPDGGEGGGGFGEHISFDGWWGDVSVFACAW